MNRSLLAALAVLVALVPVQGAEKSSEESKKKAGPVNWLWQHLPVPKFGGKSKDAAGWHDLALKLSIQPPAPKLPETKRLGLSSIYALTKYDQERTCLIAGGAYGIPTVALRLFNTYGTRQALSNPYTGALAIFASRLLNDRAPRIFEDGLQLRDFVSVRDVARAFRLALERDGADGSVVNVGTGLGTSILDVATKLAAVLRKDIEPELTGEFRVGDIRHCYADITLARERIGFEPEVELDAGMRDLAEWLEGRVARDRVDAAADELTRRGLAG